MPFSPSRSLFSVFRFYTEPLVLLGVMLLVCQTWAVDGFLAFYTVEGSSMACTLKGEHRQVVCGDCGIRFDCDSSFRPVCSRAVCPNCGYAGNDLESLADHGGAHVLMDRSAFYFRGPRRWEVIAFCPPHGAEELAIKRVVGLPGETVEIRHGDVYIDNEIARKPLDVQQRMAILVADANYASKTLPPHWTSESSASRWRILEGSEKGKRTIQCDSATDTADWLCYRHFRRIAGSKSEVENVPVEDTLTYNQNRIRRVEDVHAVADLMLSLTLTEISGKGKFHLRASDGQETFRVEWNSDTKSVGIFRNERLLKVLEKNYPLNKGTQIVVSLFDRQFLLAIDGGEVFSSPLEDVAKELPATAEPFALGSQGLQVGVENAKIFRDVYYTEPIGRKPCGWGGAPRVLGEESLYVLGDNSSISEDSRTWGKENPVLRNSLYGKSLR